MMGLGHRKIGQGQFSFLRDLCQVNVMVHSCIAANWSSVFIKMWTFGGHLGTHSMSGRTITERLEQLGTFRACKPEHEYCILKALPSQLSVQL